MGNDVPDTVSKVLDELAKRFGSTGGELWHAYVHWIQAYALSWMVGGAGGFLILAYLLGKICDKWAEQDKYDQEPAMVIKAIILFICVLAAALFVAGNLADVVAPEGSAIFHVIGH